MYATFTPDLELGHQEIIGHLVDEERLVGCALNADLFDSGAISVQSPSAGRRKYERGLCGGDQRGRRQVRLLRISVRI
jgi:hypothetical protein